MKAYIEFIGEERHPKNGEFYQRPNGEIIQAEGEYQRAWPVVIRHEIEIPDRATRFYGMVDRPLTAKHCMATTICNIPIPRPKKKVKKTVYLLCLTRPFDGQRSYSVMETPEHGGYPVEIEVEE